MSAKPSATDPGHEAEALGKPSGITSANTTFSISPRSPTPNTTRWSGNCRRSKQEHPELLTPDSPTVRVGGKAREGFQKIPHSSAMLSLDNALDEGELRAFDARVRELLRARLTDMWPN